MGRWFWLLLLLVVVFAGAVGGWRWWAEERRARNETFAWNARVTLVRAQGEYVAQQRSRGGQPSLWLEDVAGLYQFGVLDRSLAEADDRPVRPLVPKPVPVNGYYVRLLPWEEVDSDGNRTKNFAYLLHPSEPGVTGKFMYMMGGWGMYRRCAVGARPVPTTMPSDSELRQYWSFDCGG